MTRQEEIQAVIDEFVSHGYTLEEAKEAVRKLIGILQKPQTQEE